MTRFGLAPMEGVSDWPFRLWIDQASTPDFLSTPFLRATDSYPAKLPFDFAPDLNLYPLIPQVMASRPEDFVRAARLFLEAGAAFVDLNCGCPSPNPVSGGAGSSLLKTRELFLGFVQAIARDLPAGSFSVKMRTGFEDAALFDSFIDGLRDLPLRQLTVHGRTRSDRYDGESRWDLIQAARTRLPFPVVASGDLVSLASWQTRREAFPGFERAIIGRGAQRNPWVFEELRTGQAVQLSREALIYSLASFALLTEMSEKEPEALDRMMMEGLFAKKAGSSALTWRRLFDTLGGRDPFQMVTERFTLGRVKMIWNALRSSLPAPYFEPLLLRKKSLGEFLEALSLIPDQSFTVQHQAQWDWLYTSSKKQNLPQDQALS